jgi:hypothetical protein
VDADVVIRASRRSHAEHTAMRLPARLRCDFCKELAAGVIGQEPLARPCVFKVEPSTENPRTVHNEGSRDPAPTLMALGRGSRCQRTIGGVARAGSRVRDRADSSSLRCKHGFG